MFKLDLYVGTSGWMYLWNPDGFEWYVRNSGLNAVELNASFYRYPFKPQVEGWRRRSEGRLRWSIKVHRLVTHVYKLSGKAYERWDSFINLFKPLADLTDFYLFQLPPSMRPTSSNIGRLDNFIKNAGLGPKLALEWRHNEWFKEGMVEWCRKREVTVVSVDSPELPNEVYNSTGLVYVRMHGRTSWYAHNYTLEELSEVLKKIVESRPRKAYVFFNNDHDMLNNAQSFFNFHLREDSFLKRNT